MRVLFNIFSCSLNQYFIKTEASLSTLSFFDWELFEINQFENFKHLAFLYNCLNLTSVNGNPIDLLLSIDSRKNNCPILKTFRVRKHQMFCKSQKCVQCIFASTEDRTLIFSGIDR